MQVEIYTSQDGSESKLWLLLPTLVSLSRELIEEPMPETFKIPMTTIGRVDADGCRVAGTVLLARRLGGRALPRWERGRRRLGTRSFAA